MPARHFDNALTRGYTEIMEAEGQCSTTDGERLCACGCGTELTPDGPSPYFLNDHHASTWNRAQIGLPPLAQAHSPMPPTWRTLVDPRGDVMPGPAGAKLPTRAAA